MEKRNEKSLNIIEKTRIFRQVRVKKKNLTKGFCCHTEICKLI